MVVLGVCLLEVADSASSSEALGNVDTFFAHNGCLYFGRNILLHASPPWPMKNF